MFWHMSLFIKVEYYINSRACNAPFSPWLWSIIQNVLLMLIQYVDQEIRTFSWSKGKQSVDEEMMRFEFRCASIAVREQFLKEKFSYLYIDLQFVSLFLQRLPKHFCMLKHGSWNRNEPPIIPYKAEQNPWARKSDLWYILLPLYNEGRYCSNWVSSILKYGLFVVWVHFP